MALNDSFGIDLEDVILFYFEVVLYLKIEASPSQICTRW